VTSGLSWLDTSREEQRRMRELLNLFAETESRDELGIGQVRDAFSDLLFPGTSTLHTRAKYLLIVPWCYRDAEQRHLRGGQLVSRVEANERRVIKTLKDAGELDGLIGRVAGVAVKTLPSAIYWGALGQYRIRLNDEPGNGLGSQIVREADELDERAEGDWAPTLPAVPPGFPGHIEEGLELTATEASWLRDRMRMGSPDSLLAHLLRAEHRPHEASWAPWDDVAVQGAPPRVAQELRHAERFSLAVHGASLLYNLQIAERYERAKFTAVDEPVTTYCDALDEWNDEIADVGWAGWDRALMWDTVISRNPRISTNVRLRAFLETWLDAVTSGAVTGAALNETLRDLVANRERSVKRAQSRLINDRLLRTWSGGSGTRRLTFRWTQVRRLVLDVHNGLEADVATA
jgi:hypothetical protein